MTAILLLNVAVLSFWLPVVHPCNVTIHPKETAVAFGGSMNLNCTFSCTNYTKMQWDASLHGSSKEGDGWISLHITNVTEWTFQPLCLVSNGGSKQHFTRAVIYVYQFSTPNIYLAPEIVDGHSERIICNISRLRVGDSVPRNLNISLSRGGNILNSTHGNSSVEYSSVASLQWDDEAEILCVAYVQVGSEVLKKSSNRTLRIVGSPYNVRVSTDHVTYKADAKIVVTCNAEGKPFPEFSWDLPSKARVEFSDRNKTVTIHSAQRSDNGTYRCLARNAYGKSSAQVDILFEGSPYDVRVSTNRITYKPGASLVVTCIAEGKPYPKFSWDLPCKAGVKFSDSNKIVTIRSAQSSHNGTYLCLAHNAYGKSSAQVDILFDEHSRSWITALVLVSLLAVVFTGSIFWYHCRK